MQTITLSATAVALLRFRVKKWPIKIREQDLPGYQELVDAGIMVPDGADFKFSEDGWTRRQELLSEAEDRIERERYEPPDASDLSDAARELLRTCIAGNRSDGDETNRPAYRELVKARIMIPLGSFAKGDECAFRFTYWADGLPIWQSVPHSLGPGSISIRESPLRAGATSRFQSGVKRPHSERGLFAAVRFPYGVRELAPALAE